jgi:hypothetical protein
MRSVRRSSAIEFGAAMSHASRCRALQQEVLLLLLMLLLLHAAAAEDDAHNGRGPNVQM